MKGYIPFGNVFDIPRARESLHMPMLDWKDVKQTTPLEDAGTNTKDPLGCWSVWAPYDGSQRPRDSFIAQNLSLGACIHIRSFFFLHARRLTLYSPM